MYNLEKMQFKCKNHFIVNFVGMNSPPIVLFANLKLGFGRIGRRNVMSGIWDIIMAIIGQAPWLSVMYIVHKVYSNKPKYTSISILDKLIIISER